MQVTPVRRALLSVSDKEGLIEFARALIALNIEIISTGGTSQLLSKHHIPHQPIEAITGLAEMLEGRVKTLHPKIHGGILGRRDRHAEEVKQHQIDWIDLVVVNFYPFARVDADTPFAEAIEYIDIGGPTMVRAAAKNVEWVGVVTDVNDYQDIIDELQTQHGLTMITKRRLAEKAFALTAQYDGMIHRYFQSARNHEEVQLMLHLNKVMDLRYGENPHQKASAYAFSDAPVGVLAARQHQGKPLSYNNLLDADAAWSCVNEFKQPACVIVKHANPCGAAQAATIEEAYTKAYQADTLSAFGGIIALNQPCSKTIAEAITTMFAEVVIAPSFSEDAKLIFAKKPALRLLALPLQMETAWEMRMITGGLLMQEKDRFQIQPETLQVVTTHQPSQEDLETMRFAWPVLKHIKSNAILLAKNNATVGIGAGQVSRIDAVELAVRKAGEHIAGTILASDAFFPFRDSIDRIAKTGVRAIIQPGGSMRDAEVIDACNEHGLAMVFTGKRCFKH